MLEYFMVYGVIYKITNTSNGHFYIGQTVNSVNKRWWYHVRDAKRGKPWAICKAIKKYGADSFTQEVLAKSATRDELDALEIKYISELKPNYNMNRGGRGSGSPTQEVRDKISRASKNRIFTDEHKANISKGLMGRKVSQETRNKLSVMFKGVKKPNSMSEEEIKAKRALRYKKNYEHSLSPELLLIMSSMSKNEKIAYRAKLDPERSKRMQGERNPMYGKRRTDEEKQKISEKTKGKNNPYYGKRHSEEALEKMRTAHANRPRIICPHCSKTGIVSNMKRWHFDNCKEKR